MDSEPGRNEGEQKTGAAGESSQSDDSEDDSEMTAPSTWKKKYFEEEMDPDNDPNRRLTCQSFIQSAERLLDAFERYPLTNAVKDFFSLLKQCSEDLGLSRLGVINMIEKGHEHMSFHKGIKTRLGSSFKQGYYNSNTLRLRTAWKKFLESKEGSDTYEEYSRRYQECFLRTPPRKK